MPARRFEGSERACRRSTSSEPCLIPVGEIPLTQEQLADLAGASRATVNKVLRDEQAKGTIDLQRGKTIVLNADELSRRAR